MNNDMLIKKIQDLVLPIAEELNYELYYVEYVKENGEYYLRIYIDKNEGITLTDCEALSRRVSKILDEKDPIEDSYCLEVSSPGLNRGLYKEEHFKRFVEKQVLIKLTDSINDTKTISGVLKEVNEDSIVVSNDSDVTIPRVKIKSANLDGEI